MQLTDDLRAQIRAHAEAEYPREACGLVVSDVGGALQYRRCANISIDPTEEFRLAPKDWLLAEAAGKVVAVVHSHPDGDYRPSASDLAVLEAGNVPWVILSWPAGLFSVTHPSKAGLPLLGRQFVHGTLDCFTLVRDYYRTELGIYLPDVWHAYDWWAEGGNLYLDHYAEAGFERVNSLRQHDVILMTIRAKVPNHAGVYLGGGMILHHFAHQLSRRDLYGGLWQRATYGFFRHRSLG